jgi:hypothetical protein
MIKRIIKGLMVIGLPWVCMVSPAWGTEYGYIHKTVIPISPSHLKPNKPITWWLLIGCYDAWSGRYTNCQFDHKVIGLKEPYIGTCKECIENNGGHCHNYDNHPLIDPREGELEYSGTYKSRGKLWIEEGQTGDDIAIIVHGMPQVAGKILTETTVNLLGGWYCVSGCYTRTSFKDEDTLDVGVDGFKLLEDPTPDEYYFKLRSGTDTHPEGHWGTEDTIIKLKKIAEEYYKLSGRILSVNDISLPKGGLFDIHDNWDTPHIEHRTGTDADINQGQGPKNIDKIPCLDDDGLDDALREVAKGKLRPWRKCESGGRKHIDFD